MKTNDLASQMQKQWPPQLLALLERAEELSRSLGQSLYLVGGAVRDLLLGRPNLDLDLVVEGDALELARRLGQTFEGKFLPHPRFGTAKFSQREWSLDLVTARSETYPHPGALPLVRPGSIQDDLSRRDFSINAMAMRLAPTISERLVDPFGGERDLARGLIRILHAESFIDDATRILRALRYEQRLDFKLERNTQRLLRRDVGMLDGISGDRIRHEIELVLREERPERVFRRAAELGVLQQLSPSLRGDGWLENKFQRVRQLNLRPPSRTTIYLCLLLYPLTQEESERFILRLNMPKGLSLTLRDSQRLKSNLEPLATPGISPTRIYRMLQEYRPDAIQANALAADSGLVSERLGLFLGRLRYVKSPLDGQALIEMGVAPGARLGQMLDALLEARLEGRIKTRAEAKKLVGQWLKER
jgi:tRNA nucleotidyltransferase (CCA-adding enzyme)